MFQEKFEKQMEENLVAQHKWLTRLEEDFIRERDKNKAAFLVCYLSLHGYVNLSTWLLCNGSFKGPWNFACENTGIFYPLPEVGLLRSKMRY